MTARSEPSPGHVAEVGPAASLSCSDYPGHQCGLKQSSRLLFVMQHDSHVRMGGFGQTIQYLLRRVAECFFSVFGGHVGLTFWNVV